MDKKYDTKDSLYDDMKDAEPQTTERCILDQFKLVLQDQIIRSLQSQILLLGHKIIKY